MPLTETLILISGIFILVNIFLVSNTLAIVAYGLLSYTFGRELPFHYLYQIPSGLLFCFGLMVLHSLLFKNLFQEIFNKSIDHDKYGTRHNSIIGKKGTIALVRGVNAVRVEGHLWEFINERDDSRPRNKVVTVIDFKEGKLIIE